MLSLGRIVILVKDFDEAARFYEEKIGLRVLYDAGDGASRLLHLGFEEGGVWLMLARTPEAMERVGNQTGGEPVGVIYSADVRGKHSLFVGRDVIAGEIQSDGHSSYFHFDDIYGNIWIVVELGS